MRQAVIAVFNAARFDFGTEFLKSLPTDREQNAWKHRLRHCVDGLDPSDLVDGYERAKRERAPYAPNLANIDAAAKAVHAEARRRDEDLAHANAPRLRRGSGIAGYVEHLAEQADGGLAEACVAMMREILARPSARTPEEADERLTRAVAAHDKLLALSPIRPRAYGERRECGRTGCDKPGTINHATNGEGPWYCGEHIRI